MRLQICILTEYPIMSMDKLSQWGLEDGRAHPKKDLICLNFALFIL